MSAAENDRAGVPGSRTDELLVELIGEVRALRLALERDRDVKPANDTAVDKPPRAVRPRLTPKGAAAVERLLREVDGG